ncbi:hypothetical protein DAI22_12g167000 [Oryza sativa Japonica Group]|nr:hypothetical protein DAI22_12g167000 [Oryza sativa Japonica Group]
MISHPHWIQVLKKKKLKHLYSIKMVHPHVSVKHNTTDILKFITIDDACCRLGRQQEYQILLHLLSQCAFIYIGILGVCHIIRLFTRDMV